MIIIINCICTCYKSSQPMLEKSISHQVPSLQMLYLPLPLVSKWFTCLQHWNDQHVQHLPLIYIISYIKLTILTTFVLPFAAAPLLAMNYFLLILRKTRRLSIVSRELANSNVNNFLHIDVEKFPFSKLSFSIIAILIQ